MWGIFSMANSSLYWLFFCCQRPGRNIVTTFRSFSTYTSEWDMIGRHVLVAVEVCGNSSSFLNSKSTVRILHCRYRKWQRIVPAVGCFARVEANTQIFAPFLDMDRRHSGSRSALVPWLESMKLDKFMDSFVVALDTLDSPLDILGIIAVFPCF